MKAKPKTASRSRAKGSSKKDNSRLDKNDPTQVEQSLQEYQAILANAEEVAGIGSWKWDLHTQKVTWSDGMFRLFGVDRESFDGDVDRIIADRIHPEDAAAVNESNRIVLEKGVLTPLSYRIILPDGAERTVWAQGKLLYDENGRPRFLTGYVQDISERVRADGRILQLQRLYATLSQVNQVIVRARDRQELFESICDVAVKYGEISPAWVGLVDEKSGEVQPVAANGLDLKQWLHPIMSIKQGPWHNALITEAIHSSQVVTTEDVQADPRTSNLHSQVHAFPFHSLAVIPFHLRGRTLGVLVMVSGQKGLFKDQEEVRLLEEMSVDISFALDTIEKENERQQAEKARQESENRYRDLVETSNDAILINQQGKIGFINRRGLEMLGATGYDQVIGRSPLEFFHTDFHPLIQERIKRLLIDRESLPPAEQKIITLDGRTIPVEVTSTRVLADGVPSTQVILRDITQRKQAEEKLRLSEELFSKAFKSSPAALMITRLRDGQYMELNDAYCAIVGYQRAELLGHKTTDFNIYIQNDDRKAIVEQLLATGSVRDFDASIRHRSGSIRDVVAAQELITFDGEACILTHLLDVTEARQADEKLRQSEERYRLISENSADVIWVMDPLAGKFKYVSPSVIKLRGYTPAEVMAQPVSDALTPESAQLITRLLAERLPPFLAQRSGTQSFITEVDQPCKDGSIVNTEVTTTLMFNQQGEVEIVGVSRDITERKRTEQTLRENEERLRLSLQAASQGLYDLNIQTGDTVVNREYAEMLGYEYETFVETNASWIDRVHPDDREIAAKAFEDYLSGLRPDYQVEFRQRTRDGSWKWILSLGRVIEYDEQGKPLRMLGTHTDITERKQAEEILRQSEARFSKIFQASPLGINIFSLADGRSVNVNDAFLKVVGCSREELLGHTAQELNLFVDVEARNNWMKRLGQGESVRNQDAKICRKSGEIRDVLASLDLVELNGEKMVLVIASDITERKQVEETLRESEARFSKIFQVSPLGINIFSPTKGYSLNVNDAFLKVVGYSREELLGHTAQELNLFVDVEARNNWMKKLSQGETIRNQDVKIRRKSGEIRDTLASFDLIELNGEKMVLVIASDITERKQVEETLRESEARFSKIFQSSPMGILIYRLADGRAVNVNEAALKTMGYSREEILGHYPQELNIFPDGDEGFNNNMKILSQGEAIRNQDVKIRRPSGEVRDVLGSLELIELNGEKMVMVITSDITERKRAEEELRASEERYRNLIENMNDIVMEVDANGNYCYLSPNFSNLSEYPLETELGESALKHIHPDDLPMLMQKMEQAFSMERQSATYRVKRNNGEWRWLETVGKPYRASDGSMHIITVARDITERKQAEDALKQNEHVLRLFVEHSPASIAMFDRDMHYIVASRRYLVDYRLADQDLTGRSHYEIFPEIPERWREIHRRCLAGAIEKEEEDPFPREDGTLDWVRWEIRPWYEETGRIGGIILFSEVITDRKQIQDDLRLLNVSLEQRVTERTMELSYANRAKDEFLANMSHELRTPLNAILGLSESLLEQRRGPLNTRQVQSIELIASSGKHLLNLINDILEVSKIEAGKLQVHPDIVSVKELCRSSLNFIKELALKKLIDVEFTSDETISTFMADPQRVKQILINLLTNAVKFTPERGRVKLDVSTNASRDRILFSVTDTGIGIAAEDLKKLFTPFMQLDSSLARQYAGTGLGLSLVQKLTEAHGGSVQVESEIGKGSRFTVILPFSQGLDDKTADDGSARPAEMKKESAVAPGLFQKNIVVLLAEDNHVNSEMISTYLESCGYAVLVAQNGEEVLQRVEETLPDIILMDIQMPKMDGLETMQRLRLDSRFTATPILALTALVMPGDRERCIRAGANEYLSKPVSLRALVSMIEKLTESRI